MDRHVPVSLLEPLVFAHIVQIVSADDNRALHLHLLDDAFQDPASDVYVASEWALLVNVRAFNCLVVEIEREEKRQTDRLLTSFGVLNPSPTSLIRLTFFAFFTSPMTFLFKKTPVCF